MLIVPLSFRFPPSAVDTFVNDTVFSSPSLNNSLYESSNFLSDFLDSPLTVTTSSLSAEI